MRGWKVLTVLLALLGVCASVVTWAIVTQILAGMAEPAATVQAAQSVRTSLMAAGSWIGLPAFAAASLSWIWTNRLPRRSSVPMATSLCGAAAGALVATCGAWTPFVLMLGGVTTLILMIVAASVLRRAIRQTQAHQSDIDRVGNLRQHGTRVQAEIESVDFLNTWIGGEPQFDVTVVYDTPSGRRRVTRRMLTSPGAAPVPGGTVVLWFEGDGADTEDIHMVEDTSSIPNPHQFSAPSA